MAQNVSDRSIHLPDRLRAHVDHLASTIGERHFARPGNLDRAARYIDAAFREAQYKPFFQEFTLKRTPFLAKLRARRADGQQKGIIFRNVIAPFPGFSEETVVVGAHYDTVAGTPGADDNASGVAVLIEAARILRPFRLKNRVVFVAFTNEEPPFSRTSAMGSAQFVQSALQKGERILFMLCLEMVGFYLDQPASQSYPPFLKYFYPDRGHFIAVVGNLASRSYVHQVKRAFAQETKVAVESLSAPRWVRGVDFSDQMNFWTEGIPAVMITDTAFYRNPHYHRATDLPHTLDFERMAETVKGVAASVRSLAGSDPRVIEGASPVPHAVVDAPS